MNIGKGIKFVRVAAGLRQGNMAEKLGITQNYLSLLENNKAEPSIALIKKISDLFGVPVGYILWEEKMPEEGRTKEITETYQSIRSLMQELQKLRIANKINGEFNQQ